MPESKEDIIKRANTSLIEQCDVGLINELFSADYVAHARGKEYSGQSFVKRFIEQLHLSIPDLQIQKLEFLTHNDNIIVWQRVLKGTHKLPMHGIPASGKSIIWTDMVVTRFIDNRISEEWVASELAGELLLQTFPTS